MIASRLTSIFPKLMGEEKHLGIASLFAFMRGQPVAEVVISSARDLTGTGFFIPATKAVALSQKRYLSSRPPAPLIVPETPNTNTVSRPPEYSVINDRIDSKSGAAFRSHEITPVDESASNLIILGSMRE
jgi:hypothetical protein